jgi:hypothetical protein
MQIKINKVKVKLSPPAFNGITIQIINIKNKLNTGDKR